MSAAVATRQSQGPSNPTSRINSPLDTKRHFDEPKRASPKVSHRDLSKSSPKTSVKQSPARGGASKPAEAAAKATTSTGNKVVAPTSETSPAKAQDSTIAPPPPPPATLPEDGGDYFSQVPNKYREEPNPFEESFSKPDVLTPGKALLPPASQIASPNTNFGTGSTFNWGFNSLRSGPLSPAMLTGPSGHTYDASLRTGLTPNESGIRSGLTPGGSGTMFPAPSPNTQALFGFGSGPTPGTLEFQKTAMAAAQAANRPAKPTMAAGQAIPVPKPDENPDAMDVSALGVNKMSQPSQPRHQSDPFGVDANAAANGLYMLAQQGQKHQESQFVPANIPQAIPVPVANGAVPMNIDANGNNTMKRNSIATSGHSRNASTATRGQSEASEDMAGSDGENSAAKGKKGKNNATKKGAVNAGVTKGANNRRKADEPKGGPNKKKKPSSSLGDEDEDMDDIDDDDMDGDLKDPSGQTDNRKMTDEEKRKNFLERNRVAALKCRQRKKQWLANLQAKVEYYGAENDALTAQVTNLREEILTLKTLLLAHKDCPVSRATGGPPMGGLDALGALTQGDYAQLHHGYPVPQVSMAPPGPRRFS
ncbi:hypothetical protein H072_1333 [Dactylellina haptotyla CBS 200.50]|uniref:BZIP domain-containing protein n=1 Tax=Dactylellina haptotyla (strain CBS 200.50) TaxID=1284197 RepID=S8APA0_DACHA|nr:hypothetical protein H072_1333 [Dactylellina haptotyla CBS 200.50]